MPPRKGPRTHPKKPPRKSPASNGSGTDSASIRAEIRTAIKGVTITSLTSDLSKSRVKDWISTQSLALDRLIGAPGIPCGRITEIYGKNHAGKTTILAHLFAEVQRRGGIAYCVDQESTLDRSYLTAIGVDVDALEIIEPEERTIEGGSMAIEGLIDQLTRYPEMLCVVGWDSIAAAPAAKELSEPAKNQQPGYQAKAIKAMCRRITARLADTRIALVTLNQSYTRIGQTFGDPEVANGGEGLKYYASLRLHTKAIGRLPDGMTGSLAKVTVKKSKISDATGRNAEIALAHGRGIDNTFSIFQDLEARKLMQLGGGGVRRVRLSETEEVTWRGGWPGLTALCAQDPALYARLASAFLSLGVEGDRKSEVTGE